MNMLLHPASLLSRPLPLTPSHAGVRSVRATGAPSCTPDLPPATLQHATLTCHRLSFAFSLGSCSNDVPITFRGGPWRGRHSCARSAGQVDHAPYISRRIFPLPACFLAVATLLRTWEGEEGPACRWSLDAFTGLANRMVSLLRTRQSLPCTTLPLHRPPTPFLSGQRDIRVRATPSRTLSCIG